MSDPVPYPPPSTPHSAEEIYQLVRDDPGYASFLQAELLTARNAETDQERSDAIDVLDTHFALSSEELTLLDLPPDFTIAKCRQCTNTRTTFFLLDFATATASWPSAGSSQS